MKQELKKLTKKDIGCLVLVVIFGIIIFAIIFAISSDSKNKSNEASTQEHTNLDALIDSQQFIEKRLKSPATAQFGLEVESEIVKYDDSTFIIKSHVDSQNGFGALLRTHYSCILTYTKDGNVKCQNISLQQQ